MNVALKPSKSFFNVRKFERTKFLKLVLNSSLSREASRSSITSPGLQSRMECLHDDHLPKCGHGLPFDELDEWSYRSRCDIQGYQDVVPKGSTCFDL